MTALRLSLVAAGLVAVVLAAASAVDATRVPGVPPSLPEPAGTAEGAPVHALPFGRIAPPAPLPDVALTLRDGSPSSLGTATRGRWTVLQLMFAGCTSTCPIQGAIFERARADLANVPVSFLSISVDPVGDTPAMLGDWLDRFHAGQNWQAGVPSLEGLGPLLDVLRGRGDGIDVHGANAFLVDPEGRLVYMTESMPSPETIVALVRDAVGASASGN